MKKVNSTFITFNLKLLFACENSPWGSSTSTSHSAWSLKRSKKCLSNMINVQSAPKSSCISSPAVSTYKQSWSTNLSISKKTAEPCNYNILHAGEKRNNWLCGFVMMISLSARGNYVTMVMYFPWVKERNNEAGGG